MKTTTLRKIISYDPYSGHLKKLLKGLKYPTKKELLTEEQLNAELPIRFILKKTSIKTTVWALCVFASTPDWYRFKADVAELALPIFEKTYALDKRPRLAIQAARDFPEGKIGREELRNAADAAAGFGYTTIAGYSPHFATYYATVSTSYAAGSASCACACAADDGTYTVDETVTYAYIATCASTKGDVETWEEITKILLKYI